MKILLINSPSYFLKFNPNRQFSYGRFGCSDPIPNELGGRTASAVKDHYVPYPWSLGYASALLKRETSHTVKAIDAQAKDFSEKDFIAEVKKFNPDIMIAELPTISFSLCMDLLVQLKKKQKFTLIVTGLHASGIPEEVMREYPFIDLIIKGDYALSLLEYLEKGKPSRSISNLTFRQGRKIVSTHFISPTVDFDWMPYPDREDLPVTDYHDFEIAGKPTVHIVTSRGCPFTCSYCNARVFWNKGFYWKRSVKNVVDEMEYVQKKYGAKQIYFDDDIMTHDQERMVEFAKEIIKRNLKIPWTFMGDINISEKLMKLLVKAGAKGLKFGVESINPEALKDVKKAWITKEKVEAFVKVCKKYNLWVHGDFIVGLPQDTKETIKEMIKFAVQLDLDTAQIYSAQPLPGTPFYFQAKEKGWLVAKKWTDYDGNYISPVSYPWFSKKEIEEMLREFKQKWEHEAVKQYLKNPWRLIRYFKGRGFSYTVKKIKTIVKKWFTREHIFVAGT